jgi:hypothetical protein
MMRSFFLFVAGLLCSEFTFGADYRCLKEVEGKTACVAGEMMLCVKKYDSALHDFTYERRGVNNAGQSFKISQNSLYKKVAGFTPATCTDLARFQIKPTMVAAKTSKPNAKPMLAATKPLKPIAKPIKLVANPASRPIHKPIKLIATAKPTYKPMSKPGKLAAKPIARLIAKPIKLVSKSTKPLAKPTKPIAKSGKPIDKQRVAVSSLN